MRVSKIIGGRGRVKGRGGTEIKNSGGGSKIQEVGGTENRIEEAREKKKIWAGVRERK